MSDQIEQSYATVIVIGGAEDINYEHQLFVDSLRVGLEHAIKCGELLIKKKDELSHGQWMPWVKHNCRFSIQTADVYMKLSANYQSSGNFKDLNSIAGAIAKFKELADGEREEEIFDWAKDKQVEAMLDGLKDIRRGITILLATNRDPVGREYYLDMMEKALEKELSHIKEMRKSYGSQN